ncbi:hypothetical protein E2320_003385, partial [Naja naja]
MSVKVLAVELISPLSSPKLRLLVAEHISTYQQELNNVWIGLQDAGKWRWTDESTYKAWMKNEPDNYGNADHCVELTSFY